MEQLRADYETLKEEFGKQKIISDELLRSVIKGKIGILDKVKRDEYIYAAIAILCSPVFHYALGVPWWFVAVTIIMLLACILANWLIHREMNESNLDSLDLLAVARNVKNLKTDYLRWMKYGLVIIVLWAAALIYEAAIHSNDPQRTTTFCIGAVIGMIIGGIVGLQMDRKVIRACNDIIRQIEQ